METRLYPSVYFYLKSKRFDRQNDELNRFTKTLYNFFA